MPLDPGNLCVNKEKIFFMKLLVSLWKMMKGLHDLHLGSIKNGVRGLTLDPDTF